MKMSVFGVCSWILIRSTTFLNVLLFLKTVLRNCCSRRGSRRICPCCFRWSYLNWKPNLSYTGSDYNSALHELHIGGKVRTVLPPTTSRAALLILPWMQPALAISSSPVKPVVLSPSLNLSAFTVNCPWSPPKRMATVLKGESNIPSDSHRNLRAWVNSPGFFVCA